jgi:mannose-6-phosphate isomerase-like protein (cupin superfamily)
MQQQIQVISRNAIPPMRSVEQLGEVPELGELRDFRLNEQLRSFMPEATRFAVSWVRLAPGEPMHETVHEHHSLMVFYRGSGEMLGELTRKVQKDDVVVVPAGCRHGFVGGAQGLWALSIQFGEGSYTAPEKPELLMTTPTDTLEELLAHNEQRRQVFLQRPIFALLADGTLDDPSKRKAFVAALQIWQDGNPTLLFTRQASCTDPTYKQAFLRHLREEIGETLESGEYALDAAPPQTNDAVMDAVTSWFTYQMYVLDNAEKTALIHLVIAKASDTYHEHARPVLSRHPDGGYADERMAEERDPLEVEQLLAMETPKTYARLKEVVDEAWEMIGAMTDRLVELTAAAPSTGKAWDDGASWKGEGNNLGRQAELLENVVILGGGTAGWMTASYLKKAYPNVKFTLIEAPGIPRIGVGEATIPNLQKVFFDFLGIPEDEWMVHCNAAFKVAVKFVNWRVPASKGIDDHYYHTFGILPNVDNLPLSHYWSHKRLNGCDEAFDYACYKEPPLMDMKLAPRYLDGSRAMYYAWHFDAHLVADFLKTKATSWGVEHIVDQVENVELDGDGEVAAIHTKAGRKITGDLFIDCSGFRGLLINKALQEPFIDSHDHLFNNSAVATCVMHDDEKYGVEPYTSAIAGSSGWTWKIPMLGRFGSGYVYCDKFQKDDDAARELCKLWKLDPDKTPLNKIKFRIGRNRRAWVKNVVSIGLASCFVEPLESSGIYFIYAAIYQLAKHFPDKSFNPILVDRFNKEIETMFDDTRDFIQMHYLTTPREDTPYWRANKYDLKISDDCRHKLETYKAGLAVNMPVTGEDAYYGNFEAEFRNFWTNGSFYCILGGMGWHPYQAMPSVRYRPESQARAEEAFREVKRQVAELKGKLPTNYEFLRKLHNKG